MSDKAESEFVSEAECSVCGDLNPDERISIRNDIKLPLRQPICEQCAEAFWTNIIASLPKTEKDRLLNRDLRKVAEDFLLEKASLIDFMTSFRKLMPEAMPEELQKIVHALLKERQAKKSAEAQEESERYWMEERERIREQLYADLRSRTSVLGGPPDYPNLRNKDGEPTLEQWRTGYINLKHREQEWLFWLKTGIALAILSTVLLALKRVFGW